MTGTREQLADQYAAKYHEGQFRKKSTELYIAHPRRVADMIKDYGVSDDESVAIALLHDTVEDTPLTYDEIKSVFGSDVERGVRALTKTAFPNRDAYMASFDSAPYNIQIIKLCDTLDNVKTIEALVPGKLERKINDCKNFFIPLAEKVEPRIAKELRNYLRLYL